MTFQPMHEPPVYLEREWAQRHPELRLAHWGELKTLGQDAEHRVTVAVQHDLLPDNLRISAKAPLPKRVADDDCCRSVGPIFIRQKAAPQHRHNTQHRKEAGGDTRALDAFGFSASGERE